MDDVWPGGVVFESVLGVSLFKLVVPFTPSSTSRSEEILLPHSNFATTVIPAHAGIQSK